MTRPTGRSHSFSIFHSASSLPGWYTRTQRVAAHGSALLNGCRGCELGSSAICWATRATPEVCCGCSWKLLETGVLSGVCAVRSRACVVVDDGDGDGEADADAGVMTSRGNISLETAAVSRNRCSISKFRCHSGPLNTNVS